MKSGTTRILLMRPEIRVGEQSTGGMFEPNADWTQQAREFKKEALNKYQGGLGNSIVESDESLAATNDIASDYSKLFGTLASSVHEYQFFVGNRLPTKKRKNEFDWGLGSEIARLKTGTEADYALFIYTEDHYGSTGRKLLQVAGFAAAAFGVPVGVTSGKHIGYAGLIDLSNGNLVWLNADLAMGGDVRTAEGAEKRVRQLLEGFPGASALEDGQ